MLFLNRSLNLTRFLFTLSFLLFLRAASHAEPPTPTRPETAADAVMVLDPIIVTATRTERPLRDVPYAADEVTAERLKQRQVATTPDALREIPGVMVQKTSLGQGSPFIRGFTGFRTLMLIDGIRLNNSTFREGPNQYWNTIDPFSLERLELVKGQGSVLYGSDAIGGTAQAFSKPALPTGNEDGGFVTGEALYRYATASGSHVGHAETNFGSGDIWGVHLGGSLKSFSDVRVADLGELPFTGYDEWDADAKLTLRLAPDWTVTAAYQHVRQDDAWRTHRTIYARSWEGTAVGDELEHRFDQERQLGYLTFEGTGLESWVESAKLTLSWHRQDEARHRVVANGRKDIEDVRVDTFGVALDLESALPWGTLAWGGDFYEDHVDSSRADFNADGSLRGYRVQGPVADDATYRMFGLYAQQEFNPTETLDLFAGARYTYAEADARKVQLPGVDGASQISDDWSQVVGSGRFVWEAMKEDRLQFYGGASQGFRAPNLSDLTRLDVARSNEIEIPSPGLDPEQYLSLELGTRSRIGDWSWDASFYYTFIRDMIIRQPTGEMVEGSIAVAKRNAGDGYLYGFEIETSYRPHADWLLFGNLAWNDGRIDSYPTSDPKTVEEPISRLLPLTALVGVRWQPAGAPFWAEATATAAAEQDRLNGADRADSQRIPPGGTPAYFVVNLRAGYQISKNFEVIAALENVTDTDYRIHGSGQNEAGFGALITCVARF